MGEWQIPPDGGHMESASGVYYQNMTLKEIEDRLEVNDLIIIPIGSTENHGRGQNPGEDTFLVTRQAEQIALATGCTVAQPIWYGSHPNHHLGMPHTVLIPEETFVAYLRAVMAGFWNAGFRKMILLNGHGQDYAIPVAMHQFGKKYQVPSIIVNVNWWFVIPEHLRDKEHGGPFETPFIHGDECEASFSMALFPEFIQPEFFESSYAEPLIPPGHINKSGSALPLEEAPLPFWQQVGGSALEVVVTPEGTVGDATLADPEKARGGVNAILDYLERLVNDIMEKYPAGTLPPIDQLSMRPKEEIEAVIKGPFEEGGRHIYTLAYPP
ncbi:MAG: 3-dehydro-scyllo-inosose hydrolase [Acidimicrobiia bacterium]|nr:3-dehydro-scyllo-inosose hydrolase [Acidimicrobiia bacterium]